jgi:hypothetical protein
VRLAFRWAVAVTVSAAGFVLAWWVCQERIGLDEATALGIAGAVLAVVIAVAGWWAAQGADSGESVDGGGRQTVQKVRAGRDAYAAGRDMTVDKRRRNE